MLTGQLDDKFLDWHHRERTYQTLHRKLLVSGHEDLRMIFYAAYELLDFAHDSRERV